MMRDIIFPFQVLAKPSGPACNLDCAYCFYLEKASLFPKATIFKMVPDVLESFIKQYIESQPTNSVHFTWQGGEPTLLGVPYFEEIIRLQEKHAGDKQITNAIQTNGVLLDEQWGRFLRKNSFLVGISIDGPQHLHDQYRIGHDGKGTFNQVMAGLNILKKHRIEFNTLTVVNRSNQDQAGVIYNFLKSIGSKYWQFIPAVERTRPDGSLAAPHETDNLTLTNWSVEPEAYGQFLTQIFKRWIREDVGDVFVQQFEAALANELGRPTGVCVWNALVGSLWLLSIMVISILAITMFSLNTNWGIYLSFLFWTWFIRKISKTLEQISRMACLKYARIVRSYMYVMGNVPSIDSRWDPRGKKDTTISVLAINSFSHRYDQN